MATTIAKDLGAKDLRKLKASDLDAFYDRLSRRGLSATSVRRYHAVCSAALNQSVKWGLLERSPAAQASPPSVERNEPDAPTPEEIKLLIERAEEKDPELATLLLVAATTGCRRGELCGLRWSDVDFEKGDSSYGDRSQIFRAGWRSARPRRATSGRWPSTLRRCPCSSSSGNGRQRTAHPPAPRSKLTRISGPHRPTTFRHFARWCYLPIHRITQRSRADAHPTPSPAPLRRHHHAGWRHRRPHGGWQAWAHSADPDLADVRARHGRVRSQSGRSRWREHFGPSDRDRRIWHMTLPGPHANVVLPRPIADRPRTPKRHRCGRPHECPHPCLVSHRQRSTRPLG